MKKLTKEKIKKIKGGMNPFQISIFILICISTLIACVKIYNEYKGNMPVNDDYRFTWENLY